MNPLAHPFIKWVGGKRQLVPELLKYVPATYGTYHEPFVGGGALFFALQPREAVLSDSNARLIRTYRGIRDSVHEVIDQLRTFPNEKSFFLDMRKRDIDAGSYADVAAWFIYLNKTTYNGLYRVNKRNGFNSPFGDFKNPAICDEPNLLACSEALKRAGLPVADFFEYTTNIHQGDFVYFDPPYVPLSATSDFTSYTAEKFGPDHQKRLRDLALHLRERGVHVVLSNSGSDIVRQLYKDFTIEEVQATRRVNCQAKGRGAVTELIIH